MRSAGHVGSAAGRIYYATDDHAVPFERFMDAFAHRVGRPRPLHLPLLSHLLARAIIREEHMQQIALGMPPRAWSPRVPDGNRSFPISRRASIKSWRRGTTLIFIANVMGFKPDEPAAAPVVDQEPAAEQKQICVLSTIPP
jgi:hypothetical protein